MSARAPLAVRRFAFVAVVMPIVLTAIAVLVQALALPHVPDPIALHWGIDGAPDGFGAAWVNVLLTAAVGGGIPLLIALSALAGLRRGDRGATYRLLGATALALSTLMSVLGTWTLLAQRGLASAQGAPSVFVPLIASFGAALAAGALAWLVQPHEPYRPTLLPEGRAIELAAAERVVWLQRVQISVGGAVVLVAALALLVVMTLVTIFGGAPAEAAVILAVVTVVVAALVATTLAFHVRVDQTGLTVNSVVGIPRVHVPLAEVARVEAVDVNPMGEFGGWGVRWAPGSGFGVVLRPGPGIRVHRIGGRVFTVTVEDAATGAALLGALAERSRKRL